MQVDPQVWPILSQLMDEWLDLAPEERASWLANLEKDRADLWPTLRELLREPAAGFLETLPEIHCDGGWAGFEAGMVTGPYRLVREIGRGGMGVVWLAARADASIKREVALKFPFTYLNPATVGPRFKRERDILARLADARIARLYDAGTTEQGQPFLALEYVEGEPITTYCDRLRLDIDARLKLFADVLHAVQYAHTNLVVHRDLKPSNILVTAIGEVRLLDFGIAKLLADGATEETEITRIGGRALTPDYASPEQAAGGTITTTTDIYSLGILLYELLTGVRPYTSLRENAAGDMAERIRSASPARPSQNAIETTDALARNTTRKKLEAALRGDLDTIVLKAIQKEPHLRYPTADAFAQDIERYRKGQPILARPEGVWYRAKKFVIRNRIAVLSAAAIFVALAAGIVVAAWQAHRAVREQRRADIEAATARAVSNFLQKDLLAQAGADSQAAPGRKVDPDIKIRIALDRAAARVDGKFNGQPQVEAAIRQTIGSTYLSLGLFGEAQQQLERAVEIRQRVLGKEHADTLSAMEELAEIYRTQGKYAPAEALLTNALEIQHRLKRDEAPETLATVHELARIASDLHGDYARAELLYSKNLAVQRRVLGESDPGTLATLNNLAALLTRVGRYAEAEPLYKQLLDAKRRTLGEEHPSTLTTMNGLAVLYRNQGKYADSESLLDLVLKGRRRVLGEEHRDTLATMNTMGAVYTSEGKYPEAEALLTKSLEANRRVLGEENPDTLNNLGTLGELYRRENKFSQAESLFRRLLEARKHISGSDNAATAGILVSLGEIRLQQRNFAQAETLLRQALETYQKRNTDAWPRYYAECMLGASLAGSGKRAEARPLLAAGYQKLLERRSSMPFEYRSKLDLAQKWMSDTEASRP